MKRQGWMWLMVLAIFAGVNVPARHASASSSICYQFASSGERINIALFRILGLAESPGQSAFTINGKWVGTCGAGTSVPVNGTIVVSNKGPVKGARMGLRSEVARSACTPLTVECTTSEVTPKPGTWFCRLRADLVASTFTGNLTPISDANCGVFEAGGAPPPDREPPSGPDSGSGLIR